MRNVRLRDVGFISRIIEDQRAVATGIVHIDLELFFGEGHAGGVVREAKIHHVHPLGRQRGDKAVCFRARHIDDFLITALCLVIIAAAPAHHVGVHIDGVDGVGHRDDALLRKDFLNVANVAFCAVGNEDFVQIEGNAARGVVPPEDRLA